MRNHLVVLLLLIGSAGAAPAAAQLGLPPLGGAAGDVLGRVNRSLEPLTETVDGITASTRQLADARVDRLASLLRRNRDRIEIDARGELARKGELLLLDPSPAQLAVAEGAGFTLIERANFEELGMTVARLGFPRQMSLARAEKELARLLPDAEIGADNLHLPAGPAGVAAGAAASGAPATVATKIGLVDGAPGSAVPVENLRGFAKGAPRPSNHGSAIASLLRAAGARRILAADVYGADPAGGNALAISRGIDWLIGQNVRIISISLTGPSNPVLARAVAAARARGVYFVAAVGNDGPAAPPAYPASYPGVIAVTAVDGRNRALIEAGRALHLDYAAPGADIFATNAAGKRRRVRGTSFAVPFVAVRAAAALSDTTPLGATLDREAEDLGPKGPDGTYGRGLLCGLCRPTR